MELAEYWDKRFLDACDIGRGRVLRRVAGEVMRGGSGGCAVAVAAEEMADGEVAGDEPGDMTAVMVGGFRVSQGDESRRHWAGLG